MTHVDQNSQVDRDRIAALALAVADRSRARGHHITIITTSRILSTTAGSRCGHNGGPATATETSRPIPGIGLLSRARMAGAAHSPLRVSGSDEEMTGHPLRQSAAFAWVNPASHPPAADQVPALRQRDARLPTRLH